MVTNQTPVVLVNAFSISMLRNPRRATIEFRRLSVQELRELAQNARIENYIRHPATVELLQRLLGLQLPPANNIYVYRSNDIIVMISLATPQRGQEVVAVTEEDVVIYRIIVHTIE